MAKDNYAVSKTNAKLIAKSEALKKITEHNRDYLSLTLTIPLGNTALKKVHTNQWLFTNLPKEFDLANWTIIADALNSATNRYSGYVKNRWYIEAVDINVDSGGKAEMKLTLNAFASSISSYSQNVRDMQKAYTSAKSNQNKTNKNANKNKSKAVTTKQSVLNQKWIKKYKISSAVVKQVEKVCTPKQSDWKNVKAWFHWMDDNVSWVYYENHQRSEEEVLRRGQGNCVDNSRVFRSGCLAMGIKCNYIKNGCISHQYNKVYIDGKGYIVDCGRQLASWGSHWGSGGCPVETTESW